MLNAAVNNHVERYHVIDADFVKRIKDKFYVDDLTTGVIRCYKNSFRESPVQLNSEELIMFPLNV